MAKRTSSEQSPRGHKKASSLPQGRSTLLDREKTCVIVECDVGFSNALFIRGEGIEGLNWDQGLPLKNISKNEWVWETDADFTTGQFKILLNDTLYEAGENHSLLKGAFIHVHPNFPT